MQAKIKGEKFLKMAVVSPMVRNYNMTDFLRHGFVLPVKDWNVGKDEECPICLRVLFGSRNIVLLKECLHKYHMTCIKKRFKKNEEFKLVCPTCNKVYAIPDTWNGNRATLYVKFVQDCVRIEIEFNYGYGYTYLFKLKRDQEIVKTVSLFLKAWKMDLVTDYSVLNLFKEKDGEFIKNYLKGLNMVNNDLVDEFVTDVSMYGDDVDDFQEGVGSVFFNNGNSRS
ncbi:hypothetical protein HELRODRAFT_168741 [Helobdella robusta]|uniref:E3 ubiquitin-protein ligase n=1 Tax=Helobdella robusta TaxID=6412 RepID=T1F0W8_HELRO|nr:hypothetical protein HELRODRAFT_168741 [Helobdella robusta]ESO08830.1 hypothetical protein HELRODRAFT_168741 [Helobdella robusta]